MVMEMVMVMVMMIGWFSKIMVKMIRGGGVTALVMV